MKEDKITAFTMRCEPGRAFKGRLEVVDNTLEAEQEFVGGLITVVGLTDEIDIIANDEGKLQDLPLNRAWVDDKGNILDILVGNIMCVRYDNEGNFTSIRETDVPIILKRLPAIMAVLGKTVFLRIEEDLPSYEEV